MHGRPAAECMEASSKSRVGNACLPACGCLGLWLTHVRRTRFNPTNQLQVYIYPRGIIYSYFLNLEFSSGGSSTNYTLGRCSMANENMNEQKVSAFLSSAPLSHNCCLYGIKVPVQKKFCDPVVLESIRYQTTKNDWYTIDSKQEKFGRVLGRTSSSLRTNQPTNLV